jgi:hypothetical protein
MSQNRDLPPGQDMSAPWSVPSTGRPPADAGPFTVSGRHASAVSMPPAAFSGTGGNGVPSLAGTTATGHGATAVTQRRRWHRAALAAAVGGGLVLVGAAGLIVGDRLLAPAGTPARTGATGSASGAAGTTGATGNTIDTFGVATTTTNCPAASVAGAGARCTASPECWDGLVEDEGIVTTPSPLPCTGQHTWQTFAIGIMPSSVASFDVNTVQANPTVSAVCSYAVLLSSRLGSATKIPQSQWSIQVVPPDEAAFDTGVRTYRCMASLGYGESQTSQFGT